jgi:hypothetical protein
MMTIFLWFSFVSVATTFECGILGTVSLVSCREDVLHWIHINAYFISEKGQLVIHTICGICFGASKFQIEGKCDV